MDISQRLRECRAKIGLSQKEVAEHIDVSLKTYASYENSSEKSIRLDIIYKLSNLFKVNPEWLISGKGERDYLLSIFNTENEERYEKQKRFYIRLNDVYKNRPLREIANKLGISHTALSDYMNGKSLPSYDLVIKISEQENISLEWLLSELSTIIPLSHGDKSATLGQFIAEWFNTLTPDEKIWFKVEFLKKFPDFKHWSNEKGISL